MADSVSTNARSRIMAAVKSKNTSPEMIVRRLIHSLGLRYQLHVRSLPGSPDLVFPARSRIVFIHGCFWHKHSCGRCRIPATNRKYWLEKIAANAKRDVKTVRRLRAMGWSVMVVWECQTTSTKRPHLCNRISQFFKLG